VKQQTLVEAQRIIIRSGTKNAHEKSKNEREEIDSSICEVVDVLHASMSVLSIVGKFSKSRILILD
jgi:hypothetical protein